jgi:predicted metal-dependent hydrolase
MKQPYYPKVGGLGGLNLKTQIITVLGITHSMDSFRFWQGIEQFNQGDFYACHDTLEAIWMEAIAVDRNFYQGILQIAVGCYHLENYNWRGAVILLGEGIRRIQDYQPTYHDIDVSHLWQQSYQLLQTLQQVDPAQLDTFVEEQILKGEKLFPSIQKS